MTGETENGAGGTETADLVAARAAEIGDQFEDRRVDAIQRMSRQRPKAILAGLGAGVIALILSLFTGITPGFALALGGGVAAFGFYVAGAPGRQYKASVKHEAFTRFVKSFGPEFSFRPSGSMGMEFLKKSRLIPSHDERHFEDYLKGVWNGVPFSLVEAKFVDIRGSGKNRRRVTVFKGLFVSFEMPNRPDGLTVIRRDMGAVGNWFGDTFSRLDRVALEDPVFEREFEVYGEDQVAARRLLTTTFMERLRQLAEDVGDGKLQAAFYDHQLLIMIPTKLNRFEPTLTMAPHGTRRDLERFAVEMKDILEIAERLKLGQTMGL